MLGVKIDQRENEQAAHIDEWPTDEHTNKSLSTETNAKKCSTRKN